MRISGKHFCLSAIAACLLSPLVQAQSNATFKSNATFLDCPAAKVAYKLNLNISGTADTSKSPSINVAHGNGTAGGSSNTTRQLLRRARGGVEIRVLPVGDSITDGAGSSDKNGYRLVLRNLLTRIAPKVSFVGGHRSGDNNPDNEHEGYGGFQIKNIEDVVKSDGVVFRHPNVVLIHAGTNDLWQTSTDESRAGAPARLGSLIETIFCEDNDAIIVVAKIVGNNFYQDRFDKFNAAVPGIVSKYRQTGYKVQLVDMSAIRGDLLGDGVHPNDEGYRRMAAAWYEALLDVPSAWFTEPRPPVGGGSGGRAEQCARGSVGYLPLAEGNQIALGAHVPGDTGEARPGSGSGSSGIPFQSPGGPGSVKGAVLWTPGWVDAGKAANGIGRSGGQVRFADLDGDGRADYLWLDPGSGAITAWMNRGLAGWQVLNNGNPIAWGAGPASNVFLYDFNGDKRVDYLVIENGQLKIFWNQGQVGQIYGWGGPAVITLDGSVSPFNMIFGDVNGDGIADFVRVNPDKTVEIWIHDGKGGKGPYYRVSPGQWTQFLANLPDQYLYTLADVTGDGFADFCIIHNDGGITVMPNELGTRTIEPFKYKNFALGVGKPGPQVRLADFDADGDVDFFVVSPENGETYLYLNDGKANGSPPQPPPSGGSGSIGAISGGGGDYGLAGLGSGVRLADLDGDGRDDYISVGPKSEAVGFLNRGPFGNNGWTWRPINNGDLIALGVGAQRSQVQFADINGDKRADYLVINPDNGAVNCWLNGGANEAFVIWNAQGQIAAGVGKSGAGTRFADLTGDGRADYIWLDPDGRASVYLNGGSGDQLNVWWPVNGANPVTSLSGIKREDVRFTDIDGDGKADYVWVNPQTSAAHVWYNGGQQGDGWIWFDGGDIANGVGVQGKNVRFARLTASGRGDYVAVNEDTAALRGWSNWCSRVISPGGGGSTPPGTCRPVPHPFLGYPTCSSTLADYCNSVQPNCDDPPYVLRWNGETRKRSDGVDDSREDSLSVLNTSDLVSRQSGGKRPFPSNPFNQPQKGGNSRPYNTFFLVASWVLQSLSYSNRDTFLRNTPRGSRHDLVTISGTSCVDTQLRFVSADDPATGGLRSPLPAEWTTDQDLDHPIDQLTMTDFLQFATTGVLPSGRRTNLRTIPARTIETTWNRDFTIPRNPALGFQDENINDHVMRAYGSIGNMGNFIPLRNDLNRMKGTLFARLPPQEIPNWQTRVRRAAAGDLAERRALESTLQHFFATWRYLQTPIWLDSQRAVALRIRDSLAWVAQNLGGDWADIARLWEEWLPDHYGAMAQVELEWGRAALDEVYTAFENDTSTDGRRLISMITQLFVELEDVVLINIPGVRRPT